MFYLIYFVYILYQLAQTNIVFIWMYVRVEDTRETVCTTCNCTFFHVFMDYILYL